MKPFNLERALAGDPVVTRSGEDVTQITHFTNVDTEYPVVGVSEREIDGWTIDGKFCVGCTADFDLFMKD